MQGGGERARERGKAELRACRLLLLHLTVGSAVDLSDCTHERRKIFLRVYSLCATRTFDRVKQHSVCSVWWRGGRNQVCLLCVFFFFFDNLADKSLSAAGGGGLFKAVCRESVKQVSGREQQMFVVDMRPAEE